MRPALPGSQEAKRGSFAYIALPPLKDRLPGRGRGRFREELFAFRP
jgi:hypothetical protein